MACVFVRHAVVVVRLRGRVVGSMDGRQCNALPSDVLLLRDTVQVWRVLLIRQKRKTVLNGWKFIVPQLAKNLRQSTIGLLFIHCYVGIFFGVKIRQYSEVTALQLQHSHWMNWADFSRKKCIEPLIIFHVQQHASINVRNSDKVNLLIANRKAVLCPAKTTVSFAQDQDHSQTSVSSILRQKTPQLPVSSQ